MLIVVAMLSVGVVAAPALADGDSVAQCGPEKSGWVLQHGDVTEPGKDADKNDDDHYCAKHLPHGDETKGGNIFQFHKGENHKDNKTFID